MFSCTKTSDQKIQLVFKMNITQLQFLPEQYGGLRQLFEIAVEKTQLQLVLKKA
jgi:hypothetical protein